MQNTIINENWKALIKPNKLNIENSEDKSISTVTAEPLEKGYALTLGNSLRTLNYNQSKLWQKSLKN